MSVLKWYPHFGRNAAMGVDAMRSVLNCLSARGCVFMYRVSEQDKKLMLVNSKTHEDR